jgi:hypothetical protein
VNQILAKHPDKKPDRLNWTTLTCTGCGAEYTTARTHYLGQSIIDWWESRGRRCKTCVAKAENQTVKATTLEEKFLEFHRNNPAVYDALVEEGRILIIRGHRKFGISMLWEQLRWRCYLETYDDEVDFRLPNNYRAYYARLIMQQEPLFEGVFSLAELRSNR